MQTRELLDDSHLLTQHRLALPFGYRT
jgi:hypothetical protein